MVGVVKMPALVADAVALGEHLGEEIPVSPLQVVPRELGLLAHAFDEPVSEGEEIGRRAPLAVARIGQRIDAEARPDLVRQRGRPGHESIVGVVRAPLDHLDAVEVPGDPAQWDIEDRDLLAGPAQVIPEGLTLDVIAGEAAEDLVGAGLELHETVDAMPRRGDTGVERGPHCADIEPRNRHRVARQTITQEALEVWQHALRRPAENEITIRGIDFEQQHPGRHSPHFTRCRVYGRYLQP